MRYIIVPGLNGSGPDHWQTKWEEAAPYRFTRVQQNNWAVPDKASWVARLDQYIQDAREPVVLVAHSLGCITVAHWALEYDSSKVAGALLVAPADVERSVREVFRSFSPVPRQSLPFRTVVVASENDEYAVIGKLADWAGCWNAAFINVGRKGHINSASGIGFWEEGAGILEELSGKEKTRYAATA